MIRTRHRRGIKTRARRTRPYLPRLWVLCTLVAYVVRECVRYAKWYLMTQKATVDRVSPSGCAGGKRTRSRRCRWRKKRALVSVVTTGDFSSPLPLPLSDASRATVDTDAVPDEVWVHVFHHLACVQLCRTVAHTCARWRRIAMDSASMGRSSCLFDRIDPFSPVVRASTPLPSSSRRKGTTERMTPRNAFKRAASRGHLQCVRALQDRGHRVPSKTVVVAARRGHCHVLRHVLDRAWITRSPRASFYAARYGRVDCMRLLYERRWPLSVAALANAIRYGHAACVDHILGTLGTAATQLALYNATDLSAFSSMIGYAREKRLETSKQTCTVAVEYGYDTRLCGSILCSRYVCAPDHTRALGHVLAAGLYVGNVACAYAADAGHTECVRLICAAYPEIVRHHVAHLIYRWPIEHDDLDMIETLYHHGFAWHEDACVDILESGSARCLDFALTHGCVVAIDFTLEVVRRGRADMLECVLHHTRDRSWRICETAAAHGKIECLRVAHRYGCVWDAATTRAAAAYGRLDCLAYAHESGCAWNGDACAVAAAFGQNECLEYAHRRGCPWDANALRGAAGFVSARIRAILDSYRTRLGPPAVGDYMACMRYAHCHGCPWPHDALEHAILSERLDALVYAHENGAPQSTRACAQAVDRFAARAFEYLYAAGCPCDHETRRLARLLGWRLGNDPRSVLYAHGHIRQFSLAEDRPL